MEHFRSGRAGLKAHAAYVEPVASGNDMSRSARTWIGGLKFRLDRVFATGFRAGFEVATLGRTGGAPPRVEYEVSDLTALSRVDDRPLRRRPRVMVVDDNPANHLDASELLSAWGITPVLAADGAEAVALAGAQDFDLILMDLNMPVLDGIAATQQIRRDEAENARARTPVVAYTSSVFSDLDSELPNALLRSRGVDGVLAKPCDARSLKACLVRWCRQGIEPDVAPGSP
jgi:CheY-like chemotaxis protein